MSSCPNVLALVVLLVFNVTAAVGVILWLHITSVRMNSERYFDVVACFMNISSREANWVMVLEQSETLSLASVCSSSVSETSLHIELVSAYDIHRKGVPHTSTSPSIVPVKQAAERNAVAKSLREKISLPSRGSTSVAVPTLLDLKGSNSSLLAFVVSCYLTVPLREALPTLLDSPSRGSELSTDRWTSYLAPSMHHCLHSIPSLTTCCGLPARWQEETRYQPVSATSTPS